MYSDIFQKIGLAKNEARIYETLLREGSISVSEISVKSGVHRRNVYDSINRLIEKGLVFEIIQTKENRYQAVEPKKLIDLLEEKRETLENVMPELEEMYKNNPSEYTVYTYRGKEGWKNYLRDMLKVRKPIYFIGAKGGWLDARIKDFFPSFIREAKRKNLKFYHLFDYEAKDILPEILPYIGEKYKFLPKQYSTSSAVDIFGDHVNIITEINTGKLGEEIVFSVIVNKKVADSFRTWFKFMWDICPKK
jgi:sugar-specific transcriptional regulator TrmB